MNRCNIINGGSEPRVTRYAPCALVSTNAANWGTKGPRALFIFHLITIPQMNDTSTTHRYYIVFLDSFLLYTSMHAGTYL